MAYGLFQYTLIPLVARRVRVVGFEHLPPRGPYLIVANHQSYLDPPTLSLPLVHRLKTRISYLAKEPVWRGFERLVGRRGVDWMGMVRVHDRSKADSLIEAKALLARGGIVAIFPEGTRNLHEPTKLLPGHTGAARLALATGVTVVPVGIITPSGATTGQAIRNFFKPSQKMELRIGEPLHVERVPEEQFTRELLQATTRRFMAAVGSLTGRTPSA